MENNELEEMRAQLATLNEKLENENIVDEKHLGEATKMHVSELQRKLMGRIIMFTLFAAFFYWKFELGILLFLSLGLLITSIYVYCVVRIGNSTSMPMTEYARRIRKALKIYKKASMIIWVLPILLILAWGIYVLVLNWPAKIEIAIEVFFVCFFISLTMLVAYFINNVYVSPDVELMLEQVLEDLEKDTNDSAVS